MAEQLQNISVDCKHAGISRSHFYEIKVAFEKYGSDGLAPRQRRRPRMPNETPPELVEKILEMTAQFPTYSYVRISQQLRLVGVGKSPAAVRGVWVRQELTLKFQRVSPANDMLGVTVAVEVYYDVDAEVAQRAAGQALTVPTT